MSAPITRLLYLTNDNTISEPLGINLKVDGQKPAWTVDPHEFQYNMSIYGKMRFSGIFSSDPEDLLAVFQKGQCVGVTTSTYDKNLDMWYALLTVYSNVRQSEDLEFRMWDAGTGTVYSATPDRQITFVNDAITGSPGAPVIFDGLRLMFTDVHLNEGWNWVSFNLYNENLSDVNAMLQNGSWTTRDVVKSPDDFDAWSDVSGRWTGNLSLHGGLNNTAMFNIHSSVPQTLSVSGAPVDAAVTPVPLSGNRWNAIAYLPVVNLPLKEALAGYNAANGDIIKSQTAFAMFYGNAWTGSLKYMEPGKGYMLLNTMPGSQSLYYPSVTATMKKSAGGDFQSPLSQPYCYAYPGNLSIVATAEHLQSGDKISAYVNGEQRATGTAGDSGDDLAFITVPGEAEGDMIRFALHQSNGDILWSRTILPFRMNAVYGSVADPLVLDFGSGNDNITVYPSPFDRQLTLSFMPENSGKVMISMYDASGKFVYTAVEQATEGILFEKIIPTESLPYGIYLLNIIENDKLTIKKVVK